MCHWKGLYIYFQTGVLDTLIMHDFLTHEIFMELREYWQIKCFPFKDHKERWKQLSTESYFQEELSGLTWASMCPSLLPNTWVYPQKCPLRSQRWTNLTRLEDAMQVRVTMCGLGRECVLWFLSLGRWSLLAVLTKIGSGQGKKTIKIGSTILVYTNFYLYGFLGKLWCFSKF